jgi:hypothetical protein
LISILLRRIIVSALLFPQVGAFAAAPTFKPDVTFQESSLLGWHTLRGATGSAKDGTIAGKSSSNDGWLMLDKFRIQTSPAPNVAPPHAPRFSMPTMISRPVMNVRSDDWNSAKAIVDLNAVRTFANHFEPHQIDTHSGGGSNILAADMNRDGKLNIVTSTRFGTFIFLESDIHGEGSAKAAR